MKFQKGHFIELPDGFEVTVPGKDEKFDMNPSGLYLTYNCSRVWINYAGDRAGDSYATMEIPSDPKFLRKFAREVTKFAKRLEERFS